MQGDKLPRNLTCCLVFSIATTSITSAGKWTVRVPFCPILDLFQSPLKNQYRAGLIKAYLESK